jgi:hypothetical protein
MARDGRLEMLAAHVAKGNAGEFQLTETDGFASVGVLSQSALVCRFRWAAPERN